VIGDALGAYAHFLAIFVTLSLLVSEAALYRDEMTLATLVRLRRIDLGYLFAAIAIIVTGLARVFWFGKGVAFYIENPVFWIKLALFLAVGLLSVPPTLHYLRLSGQPMTDGPVRIPAAAYRRIRLFLVLQLAIFAVIPLAAAIMALGIGV